MTYDEMKQAIQPGETYIRATWNKQFYLKLDNVGVLRLYDKHNPGFSPEWLKRGYDANATDYMKVPDINLNWRSK
jgi:hypothetical protein